MSYILAIDNYNFAYAFRTFRKSDPYDADANYVISQCYLRGIGVDYDINEYLWHCELACSKYHPGACCSMAKYIWTEIECSLYKKLNMVLSYIQIGLSGQYDSTIKYHGYNNNVAIDKLNTYSTIINIMLSKKYIL